MPHNRAASFEPLGAIYPGHTAPVSQAIKKDGLDVEIDVYSSMTAETNAITKSFNHERSPVLLTKPEEWQTWMRRTPDEAFALVKPIDAKRLHIVQEGLNKSDLIRGS